MNIESKVIAIVSEQSGISIRKINRETTDKDLDMDSLDQVEVIMALEEEFSIEIPDEDAEHMTTVGNMIDYIIRKN